MDRTIVALRQKPLAVGGVSLRDILGVDRGLVVRWSETTLQLMPHGGTAVIDGILAALAAAGLAENRADIDFPEAADEIEARMLDALSRGASPLAIDLLLDQPRRWRAGLPSDAALDAARNRLIDPPLVAVLGAPNIGKSTLTNALAGRAVSIVADEPGTTRDHVGVRMDFAGLVVRWVDTPGLRDGGDEIEAGARSLALGVAAGADLLILAGDAGAAPPTVAVAPRAERVTLALRTDLGAPAFEHDAAVCARSGEGIAELVSLVRARLVPDSAIADERAWKFW